MLCVEGGEPFLTSLSLSELFLIFGQDKSCVVVPGNKKWYCAISV